VTTAPPSTSLPTDILLAAIAIDGDAHARDQSFKKPVFYTA